METVVIVAPTGYESELRSRLATLNPAQMGPDGMVVVADEHSRVYFARNDYVLQELEPEQLAEIVARIDPPVFYSLDFSDIALCRRVLEAIADDPRLLVDNDFGVVLTGSEFVDLMRRRPDWRSSRPASERT